MTTLELVLNMLAEATTTEISKAIKPETFDENKQVARTGGSIAGHARSEIEEKTGKPVITSSNAKSLNRAVTEMIESAAGLVSDDSDDKDE